LVRCCCGGLVSYRQLAPTSPLVSATWRWLTYTTQPGSLPGCSSCLSAPPPWLNYYVTLFPNYTSFS